jgi:NADP-dependent 3-hydroxy acid dehydrogenase YdfG/phage shock protein PspC (stress-responsive transcriptional regulator)
MLKNKIILITGASSGIGAATAREFAKQGAKLLLCARQIEKLNGIAEQLQSEMNALNVHTFALDVRQHQAVKEAFIQLPNEWKNIDILLNNAGLAAGLDTLQEGDVQDWEAMIDTNIKGLLYVTREVLPQMVAKNRGHIINIGSVAGHTVYPKGSVYCATKHAVKALTDGLRMDLFGTKIRATTIDPGAVETNFSLVRFKGDKKRAGLVYQGMEPLTAADIAETVLYCATRPPHVNISEIIIMPTDQASATMIYREATSDKEQIKLAKNHNIEVTKMENNKERKLYRSRKDRMIAGICGGLAQHFGIDPTWVRLFFVLLFFLGGCSILIYIIMWVIVPLEPETLPL